MPRKPNKKPVTTIRVYTSDKSEIASIAGEMQAEAGQEVSHANAVAYVLEFYRLWHGATTGGDTE